MAKLRVVPLGTNGFIPTHGRHTMSFLVTTGEGALLLDAGTGVARLAEPSVRELLAPYARLEIALTHYHLDHLVGISFLLGLWRDREILIHAPDPPLVAMPAREALARLISPPLFPIPFERWPMPIAVEPYGPEGFRAAGLEIRVRAQKHPGGSAGLRLGDTLVYATDTIVDPATAEFARGAKLLLHEVWSSDEEAARDDASRTGHSAATPVAALARAAGVERLWIVHHHPLRDAAGIAAIADEMAARAGCIVEVPAEGAPIDVE